METFGLDISELRGEVEGASDAQARCQVCIGTLRYLGSFGGFGG
jgi:hypothetical protein